MKKLFTLVPLFTIIIFNSFAQQNFVKGYLVTNAGDTLQGTIDNKDWLKNPSSISFKYDVDNKTEKKTPLQIKSFYVSENNEFYESYKVSIDISPYENSRVSNLDVFNPIDFVVPDTTLFLRVLVKGSANLYSFTDKDNKRHFYFSKTGNNSVEELILQKSVFIKNGIKYLGENKIYQTQLTSLSECVSLNDNSMVSFTTDDLKRFFKSYNQCLGGGKSITDEKRKTGSIQTSVMIGGSFTMVKQNIKSTTTQDFYPIAGIGLDYVVPRNRNRWRVGTELWLQTIGQKDKNSTSFIKINMLVKYQILVNKGIRPYVVAGYGSGKVFRADKVDLTNNSFVNNAGFLVGFGLTKNRWAFETRAERTAGIMNWLHEANDAYNFNLFLKYQIF